LGSRIAYHRNDYRANSNDERAVQAENATKPPRLGRPRTKVNVHASQTSMKGNKSLQCVRFGKAKSWRKDEPARIWERHRWSTFCRNLERGIAPSQQKDIHHPRTRCHRRSFPDKAPMWMQMDTEIGLALSQQRE